MRRPAALLAFAALMAAGCAAGEPQPPPTSSEETPPAARAEEAAQAPAAAPVPMRRLRAEVVATYPHDPGAFTQGLELAPGDPGTLLESTGNYGASELRRVDLASGEPMRRLALPRDLFAEGLTLVPGAGGAPGVLVQLTWREGVALLWDSATFERRGEHRYAGEGWGLCYDAAGDRLVMSDGSAELVFRDPRTFAETGRVEVDLDGRPARGMNELECVDGRVWANLYGRDYLAEIDPESGRVIALADARGLLGDAGGFRADVMNGIAHDPADGTFLVTGKWWPKLFRVRLVPAAAAPP